MADFRNAFYMVQQSLEHTGTSLLEMLESTIQLDDDWFDGTVTYTLEIVLESNNVARTATVRLRERGQSTNLVSLSTTNTTYTRLSGTFTYPASPQAAKEFTLSFVSDVMPGDIRVASARIYVDQTGTLTKRAFHIPLGTRHTFIVNSFAAVDNDERKFWLYEAAKFDGTIAVHHHFVGRQVLTNSNPARMAIAEKGLTTEVTGSGVDIISNTVATLFKSGDIKANLVDGKEYEVIGRGTVTPTNALIDNSNLLFIQTGTPKKSQVAIAVGWDNDESVADNDSGQWNTTNTSIEENEGQRTQIDLSKYSAATAITAFFESTGFTTGGADNKIHLVNATTGETGARDAVDDDNVHDDTVPTRKRGSAVTIVNGKRYFTGLQAANPETVTGGGAWIIIDVDDSAVPSNGQRIRQVISLD